MESTYLVAYWTKVTCNTGSIVEKNPLACITLLLPLPPYSSVQYVWAFQLLSTGFQGGHVTHASIVGRREEEPNEGEMFDV